MRMVAQNKLESRGDVFEDKLSEEMPANNINQFQNLIRFKDEESRTTETFSNKPCLTSHQIQNPKPTSSQISSRPPKKITALQQEFHSNNANSSYVVDCIMRALKYRKLAIDDVADIFGIDGEVVDEIDQYRRLKAINAENGRDQFASGHRLGIKKEILIKQLQLKFKNAALSKVRENSFTKGRVFQQKPVKQSSPLQFGIFDDHSKHQLTKRSKNHQRSELLQSRPYQADRKSEAISLLKSRPPHKIDEKTIAIVQTMKKYPNMMQKQIIKVLGEEYGIENMTQTAISRYFKKIYEMKKHVSVLIKAREDGFVDF